MAMSLPALREILQRDANTSFDPVVSERIWVNICKELGFSTEIIAATTPQAISETVVTTTTAVSKKGGMIALSALTTGMVAVTAIFGMGFINTGQGKTQAEDIPIQVIDGAPPLADLDGGESSTKDINSTLKNGDDIKPPADAEIKTSVSVAAEAAQAPDGPTADDIPPEYAGATTPTASSEAVQSKTSLSVSSGAAASGTVSSGTTSSSTIRANVIQLEQDTLRYPVGTVLTSEMILADSGATAADSNGNPLKLVILYLEQVDTSKANSFGVFVQFSGADDELRYRKAIIIYIEE